MGSVLAILRPGAIGDVIMTLNLIPLLKARWPGREVRYYCNDDIREGIGPLMLAAGVDAIYEYWKIVRGSEHIKEHHEQWWAAFALVGYPFKEGYPLVPMRQHLIRSFADEMNVSLDRRALPSLRLPRPPRPAGLPERYATLHVKTRHSNYKNWPIDRWSAVVASCCDQIPIYQLGHADEPRVEGADHSLMGSPLMVAVEAVANARFHMGLDSFPNHLTNFTWEDVSTGSSRKVPGVILWGSTQVSSAGYPHNANVNLGLPCQPCFRENPDAEKRTNLGACPNPPLQVYNDPHHACMFGITVGEVVAEVQRMILRTDSE